METTYRVLDRHLEVMPDPDGWYGASTEDGTYVGLVAAATLELTIDGAVHTIPLVSPGVWGIDDGDDAPLDSAHHRLVAGSPVPAGHWVLDEGGYAASESEHLDELIRGLTTGMTPTRDYITTGCSVSEV